ncbi:GRIP and coiled-coil domain-containing protein-like [Prorops nasuta]|uniref:GRIP and coiled-coil domain-containing protein-like n=1 Tax=Prorops nasuta TaxID=863751 RepID=UPI0034CF7FB3
MSINKFGGASDSSRYKDHLQYKRKREISMHFNYSEHSFDAQNKKIINVFDPENINDAVTLKYLHNLISENNDKIYQHIHENTLSKINEKDVDLRKFKDLHILTEIRNLSDEINIHNETNDIKLNKVKNDILTYSNEELTKLNNSFKDLRTIVNSEINNFEKTIKSLEVKIDEKAKVLTEEEVNEKINALVKEFNEKLKDINKPLKTQLLQENQSFSETRITSGSIPLKVLPNPKEVLNKQIDHLKSISNTQNNENKQLKNQLRLENHQPFFGTGIMTSGSIPLKKIIPDAKNNEKGE